MGACMGTHPACQWENIDRPELAQMKNEPYRQKKSPGRPQRMKRYRPTGV